MSQPPLRAHRPVVSVEPIERPRGSVDTPAVARRTGKKAGGGRGGDGRSGGKGPRGGAFGRGVVKWLVVLAIWVGIFGAAGLVYFGYDLPDIAQVAQFQRRPSVTVLAADGSKLARFGDMRGETLAVDQISPDLVHAVLAVEDRRFYSHFGIDPIGVVRAIVTDLRSGHMRQGASTITQQLARNLFLSPAKNLRRKVQEAMLAVWLERRYSKDQILGAYLNRVYLGAGTYGVDAAARTYFDKSAADVNLQEAAVIAGLLKAPSKYNPTNSATLTSQRLAVVLETMVDAGFITQDKAHEVAALPLPQKHNAATEGDARYYAAWVADQVNAFVGPNHGDLVVQTTFDAAAQRAATVHVKEILDGPGAAANVTQAAVVVMAPDGAVRALVGGRDYDDSPFNRATQAQRQPGSSFKPFVYLAALEAGRQPDSLILDAPYKRGKWEPKNYEPGYMGEITLATALAHSVNTATIRLLEETGIDRAMAVARRLGITAPLRRDLSLALGTSEVTLMELTGAYTVIGNGGRAVIPYAITQIQDGDGAVVYQRQSSGAGYAIASGDDANLTRMMMGVLEFGTGKSARLDRPAAGKTGTTQDYHDAWFMGFTADVVTGVWMGNDDGDDMKKITGGKLPAQLWKLVMTDLERGQPVRDLLPFQPPPVDQGPVDTTVVSGDQPEMGEATSPETVDRAASDPQDAAQPGQDDAIGDLLTKLKTNN